MIDAGLRQHFRSPPRVQETRPALTRSVEEGSTTPAAAGGFARLSETLIPVLFWEFFMHDIIRQLEKKKCDWLASAVARAYPQPTQKGKLTARDELTCCSIRSPLKMDMFKEHRRVDFWHGSGRDAG